MKAPMFGFPLTEGMLAEFVSPVPGNPLAQPWRMDREIVAANGWLAIRCHSGRWIDAEFPPAPREVTERIERLPWAGFEEIRDADWRELHRSPLLGRGEIFPWLGWKPAPSPVWMVGFVPVRLSFLQLVARLPRAAVAWGKDRETPLFFRFSGGKGIIAQDAKLAICSNFIFQPEPDRLTGGTIVRSTARGNFAAPPPPEPALEGWPPADFHE